MIEKLRGLVAAVHTPFHSDGSLALEVVDLQAEHLVRNNVGSVFITGTTGESHSLTLRERLEVFGAWAEAGPAHGISVVAHVGGNCLEDARILMAAAADLDFIAAAALMPCYFKPDSVERLVGCSRAIASSAPDLPFYYYHIPKLTGLDFDMAEFLKKAAVWVPNLAGIKFTHDDLVMYSACRGVEDGRFDISWGIDELYVQALGGGAESAVGSTYNFAAPLYQEAAAAVSRGEMDRADELQRQALWLIDELVDVGYFAGAKALMGWLGVPVGPPRLPLGAANPKRLAELRARLEDFEWFGPTWNKAGGAGPGKIMESVTV